MTAVVLLVLSINTEGSAVQVPLNGHKKTLTVFPDPPCDKAFHVWPPVSEIAIVVMPAVLTDAKMKHKSPATILATGTIEIGLKVLEPASAGLLVLPL